jgi:hypothetical protein
VAVRVGVDAQRLVRVVAPVVTKRAIRAAEVEPLATSAIVHVWWLRFVTRARDET